MNYTEKILTMSCLSEVIRVRCINNLYRVPFFFFTEDLNEKKK